MEARLSRPLEKGVPGLQKKNFLSFGTQFGLKIKWGAGGGGGGGAGARAPPLDLSLLSIFLNCGKDLHRLHTTASTHATTPNIVGRTM